jgi:hypothetical protein
MQSYGSAPRPPPSSCPVSKLSLFLRSSCVSPVERTGQKRGGEAERVGKEPNHMTARKTSPL